MASPERDQIVMLLRSMAHPGISEDTIPRLRALLEDTASPPPRGTQVDEVHIDGLVAEWLRCGDVDPDRRLLYLHGGAYLSGSRRSHRALAARIGRAAGCAVLLPEYRLAPEHAHPAAVHDALAALQWMERNAPDGSRSASRIFLAGDSAGGGLALATLLAARDAGGPAPSAAVTLSAWTDLAMTGESFTTRAQIDPMLPAIHMHACAAAYLCETPAQAPLASPLYGDLAGLPPLLMQVGDEEVLLDDTVRFGARAREAGVDATVEVWPEMFHVFQAFSAMLPEGREALGRIGAFLRAR
jgi:acetyl esterase/lipase